MDIALAVIAFLIPVVLAYKATPTMNGREKFIFWILASIGSICVGAMAYRAPNIQEQLSDLHRDFQEAMNKSKESVKKKQDRPPLPLKDNLAQLSTDIRSFWMARVTEGGDENMSKGYQDQTQRIFVSKFKGQYVAMRSKLPLSRVANCEMAFSEKKMSQWNNGEISICSNELGELAKAP